jgi:hypothetical protein
MPITPYKKMIQKYMTTAKVDIWVFIGFRDLYDFYPKLAQNPISFDIRYAKSLLTKFLQN